jgi:hypothetical protein
MSFKRRGDVIVDRLFAGGRPMRGFFDRLYFDTLMLG